MSVKSQWVTIDRIGTKGIEPDMMPVHRTPESLDEAVNVRALGANLANAGGYRLVANGSLPQETIPSSCLCPTVHYERTSIDGEVHIDQSWFRAWPSTADHWITAFQVNAGAQDYDQILSFSEGDCENSRLETLQVQVLNTASSRKVRLIQTDATGAEVAAHLDYDASAEFGDGLEHWVFVEHQDSGGLRFNIVLDSTPLYDNTISFGGGTDYVTFTRANSQAGTTLPVVIWSFSQSVWTCLTGGGYTGLGSCGQTGEQIPIRIDVPRSSPDLNFHRGDVVAVPKLGTPTARNAWATVKPVTGPVYYEIPYDQPTCRSTTYWGGGAGGGVALGNNPPGTVAGSFGMNRIADFYIDNVRVQENSFQTVGWTWLCVAYDPIQQQVWVGNAQSADVREWAGNKVPGVDAGYPCVITDLRPVMGFQEPDEAMRILGTGSRFPLPSGFSYLEPS